MPKPIGLEPVELNDAELAAVAGGVFDNSFNGDNSLNGNNSFNNSFRTA